MAELVKIHSLLDLLVDVQRRQASRLERMHKTLEAQQALIDGFTSGGSSFRAAQVDPAQVAYAAILGPILGDRIDATVPKGDSEAYLEEMMRGAAVMSRRLLRVLDTYLSERSSLDYLEHAVGDIQDPGQPSA